MLNIKFIGLSSVVLKNNKTDNTIAPYIVGSDWVEFLVNSSLRQNGGNYYFEITGNAEVQVSGQITEVTEDYQFFGLFSGCKQITDASQLILSAPTMKKFCYANMFLDCTNLTTPPQIQASTLDQWCYSSMFGNCYSLTAVPVLSATTLADYCYFGMFYNCKALSSAPNLPAQTLEDWCYNSMFYNCQNLTSISADFTSWGGNATTNWVTNINTEGQFYNDNVDYIYGVDNVPESWQPDYSTLPLTFKSIGDTTIAIDKGNLSYNKNNTGWTPYTANNEISLADNDTIAFSGTNTQISASFVSTGDGRLKVYGNPHSLINWGELSYRCFRYLFQGNDNIIDATELFLPSLDLTDDCYSAMFRYCHNLTGIPDLPATGLAFGCYGGMFQDCTYLTDISNLELPALDVARYSYYQMFRGCTNIISACELPATGLASNCYQDMFFGTNITELPELPATELVEYCYNGMFAQNPSLVTIPSDYLQATNLASHCYYYMFGACSNLTAAPQLPATTTAPYCYEEMFLACRALSTAPDLPATGIASEGCYRKMFWNCSGLVTAPSCLNFTDMGPSSCFEMFDMHREDYAHYNINLKVAPELPATGLAKQCYDSMFADCGGLTSINVGFTDWADNVYATNYWFGANPAASGTFTKPSALPEQFDSSHIPNGWTVINK